MPIGASQQFDGAVDPQGNLTSANVNSLDVGANVFQSTAGGRNIRCTPGSFHLLNGGRITRFDFAGQLVDLLLGPSVTTFVFLDSVGVFKTNTTGFPTEPHVPLAEVTTDSTTVVAPIVNRRPTIVLPAWNPQAPLAYRRLGVYVSQLAAPGGGTFVHTALADTLLALPLPVGEGITVDRVAMEVTTAGAGGSTVRMGLYLADLTDPSLPGALLVDAATLLVDSTGVKEISLGAPVKVGRNRLFAVYSVSDAAVAMRAYDRTNNPVSLLGLTAAGGFGVAFTTWRGTLGANPPASALPSTFPVSPTALDQDVSVFGIRAA